MQQQPEFESILSIVSSIWQPVCFIASADWIVKTYIPPESMLETLENERTSEKVIAEIIINIDTMTTSVNYLNIHTNLSRHITLL